MLPTEYKADYRRRSFAKNQNKNRELYRQSHLFCVYDLQVGHSAQQLKIKFTKVHSSLSTLPRKFGNCRDNATIEIVQ